MPHRIFIDGQAGTTGLDIHARLSQRADVELIEIDPARRKDPQARREQLNAADLVVLCLPDDAAREAVALIESDRVRVLDASTAHRVRDDWVYGLPELEPDQRAAIADARRVANPGCYPTGFLLAVRPLRDAGWLGPDVPLVIQAISGYSGGGRQLIERYTSQAKPAAARPYALTLHHKHLPEMQHYARVETTPLFCPAVADFHKGMLVQVPLHAGMLRAGASADALLDCLRERYADEPLVQVIDGDSILEDGFLDPRGCNDSDRVELMVFGDDERLLLVARLDNLGKGAAGAAVQNLNIMLGADEGAGLAA